MQKKLLLTKQQAKDFQLLKEKLQAVNKNSTEEVRRVKYFKILARYEKYQDSLKEVQKNQLEAFEQIDAIFKENASLQEPDKIKLLLHLRDFYDETIPLLEKGNLTAEDLEIFKKATQALLEHTNTAFSETTNLQDSQKNLILRNIQTIETMVDKFKFEPQLKLLTDDDSKFVESTLALIKAEIENKAEAESLSARVENWKANSWTLWAFFLIVPGFVINLIDAPAAFASKTKAEQDLAMIQRIFNEISTN